MEGKSFDDLGAQARAPKLSNGRGSQADLRVAIHALWIMLVEVKHSIVNSLIVELVWSACSFKLWSKSAGSFN